MFICFKPRGNSFSSAFLYGDSCSIRRRTADNSGMMGMCRVHARRADRVVARLAKVAARGSEAHHPGFCHRALTGRGPSARARNFSVCRFAWDFLSQGQSDRMFRALADKLFGFKEILLRWPAAHKQERSPRFALGINTGIRKHPLEHCP